MKKLNGGSAVILGLALNLVLGSHSAMAQTSSSISDDDLATMIKAIELTSPVTNVPSAGTFYSAQHAPGSGNEWPPFPADVSNLPAWDLGDGVWLLADEDFDYETAAQTSSLRATDGGGFRPGFDLSTNNLAIQILDETNGIANFVVYPPSNDPNGVWDLLETTNLTSLPIDWQWVLRNAPGQTNLIDPNATNAQEFYALGSPNDLTANDSLGTDFWVTFCEMPTYSTNQLTLCISSPVGATGSVAAQGVLGNGPVLIITNCGEAALNGTYVLTNLTTQEETNWAEDDYGELGRVGDTGYVDGTNWVVQSNAAWYLFSYNSSSNNVEMWYYLGGNNLNASATQWQRYGGNSPPPTSLCAQLPFSAFFSVAAGTITNVTVPDSTMIASYDTVEITGIHITATQPVSVYAFDYSSAESAAFTCYPTPLLGTNYCLMSKPSDNDGGQGNSSQFAIVATEDDTHVTLNPPTNADLDEPTSLITLQQGQVYQLASVGGPSEDVTGTVITSDNPIAIFAGVAQARIPSFSYPDENPLVQEQLPVESWGTQFLSMSFAGRTNGDSYRVLAAYSNTVVTSTGTVVITNSSGPIGTTNEVAVMTNQAGQFFDIIMTGPVEFQGTEPIQVAHFGNGHDWDNLPNNEGDPCEVLLSPTGYYLMTNIVYSPPNDLVTGDFDHSFLTIIAPQSATNSTYVDTNKITTFIAITNSGYYGAQMAVTSNSVHTVTSSQPVGVEVYGWGNTDAYGYFGGVVR